MIYRDHPRLRGEYKRIRLIFRIRKGSPPLTRGIQFQDCMEYYQEGITPAYAGNTRSDYSNEIMSRDHPRLRGEYSRRSMAIRRQVGSPPLTRGIPAIIHHTEFWVGITPAYAGNTPKRHLFPSPLRDHPRLRGEYISQYDNVEDQLGSPPLTRGIPNQAQKSYVGSRITPAYAGNTPDEHVEGMATEDHPRLRGEYLKIAITQLTDKGSPPLTRGIQDRIALIADPCGITPAYAGNTLSQS
ncbi:Domain of uncharacterised function (DUF2825) [uncultured Clostridium sp.]|nr:Domain of uncharacterised function (DUF2825) [uncultured Clostridium sp.]